MVPKDIAFSEGAIPNWECIEISVSQLDRRYDLLDGKILVVYKHLLMNLLRMIRLERNRTNQSGRFNAGFYEEITLITCSTTFVRPKERRGRFEGTLCGIEHRGRSCSHD